MNTSGSKGNTTIASRRKGGFGVICAAIMLAGGCATSVPDNQNVPTMAGPAPTRNTTRVDEALQCLARFYPTAAASRDLRIAVNDFTDGTGTTLSGDSLSRVLTQRPDVMLTVGLSRTGVRMVNRSSIGVAEWELKQAMQKFVGDGRVVADPNDKTAQMPYRPITAGSLLGSTHYVSGAISELNWNLSSSVAEAGVGGLGGGQRVFRISIAMDVMVTDTRSTEIVMARSYSKQLVGYETGADLFRFFDVGQENANWGRNELFQFSLGQAQNEPVQAAVRWMLETAAYEIVSDLGGIGSLCDELLPEDSRPNRQLIARRGVQPTPVALQTTPAQATAVPSAVATGSPPATTPAVASVRADGAVDQPGAAPAAATGAAAPAARTAATATRATPPAPAPAANIIDGVNLLDDADTVVLRIDTRVPLERNPVVHDRDPTRLMLDFVNARNGVGELTALEAAAVSGVKLQEEPRGSRITVSLSQPCSYEIEREGKSLLVILKPLTAAQATRDDFRPAGGNRS